MYKYIAGSASIGENCRIGNFVTVQDNVRIGNGCTIGNNVVIHPDATIGDNVRIDDNAVIGKIPMRAANSAVTKEQELPPAEIGRYCIIGTSVVIYRGCKIGEKVLVADLATVRENVTVGSFTIVGRGVAIENLCEIGAYCKLESNVYICAYSKIEDRCFIAPCVATSNDNYLGRTEKRFKEYKGVTVKRGGRIGVNATILPGKVVGEDTVVAAGAVLTRHTEPKKIYTGVPARYFRDVPDEELLLNQKFMAKK
jgi:UDP-2-acetamido-3-amino-2,3-dideoxy-glucuronate N-acetyltransferase